MTNYKRTWYKVVNEDGREQLCERKSDAKVVALHWMRLYSPGPVEIQRWNGFRYETIQLGVIEFGQKTPHYSAKA